MAHDVPVKLSLCIHPEVPQAGLERRCSGSAEGFYPRDLCSKPDRNSEGSCTARAGAPVAERTTESVAESCDAVNQGQVVTSFDARLSVDPQGVLGSAPLGPWLLRGDDGQCDG